MKNKLWKFLLITSFILLPLTQGATSLDDLINSYDYDFSNNQINVTQIQETISDKNNNQINDTINFRITTNLSNPNYLLILTTENNNYNYTNITNLTNEVSISTHTLDKNKFNYTIEIRDNTYSLIYRKTKLESNTYSNYERGIEITNIQDSYTNNQITIQLNLVNITDFKITPISLNLNYNNNENIDIINNVSLIQANQVISISIPNNLIAKTHYVGNYSIYKITIEDKTYLLNYTTLNYNFENFATTSYIKTINFNLSKNDTNELYDNLDFILKIKTFDTNNYQIYASLYDENDEYISSLNKTFNGLNSTQEINLSQDTKILYKFKAEQKYKLKNIILIKNSNLIDKINEYITEQINYSDFEKPNQADLSLKLKASYNETTNTTNLIINITNSGEAPAFNTKLNIFSENYDEELLIPYLNINESTNIQLTIENDTEGNIYTVFADITNTIDESNEENNYAQVYTLGASAIKLESEINVLDSNLIEIILRNKGIINLDNIQITLNNHTLSNILVLKNDTSNIYIQTSLVENQTYQIDITSDLIFNSYNFSYKYSNLTINHTILELDENISVIEYNFENNENETITFNFNNVKYKINPLSNIKLIQDKIYQNKTPQYLLNHYYEKGLMKNYSIELLIDPSNINYSIEKLETGLNSIYEIKFNTKQKTNLTYSLSFKDNTSITRNIYLIPNITSIVILEHNSNTMENSLKTISYLKTVYNVSFEDDLYQVNQLDSSLIELIFSNEENNIKEYTFTYNNKNYTIILNVNQTKKMYIDGSIISQINSFTLKTITPVESFTALDSSSLYEIILKNMYNSTKKVSFFLGGNSHSFNLSKNERKVVLIDTNQDNLNIQNLTLE